jgi:uncharacterized protein
MNVVACWFEIPVIDQERSVRFYSEIFEIKFEWQENGGFKMAFFPEMSGALVIGEGYNAGNMGTMVYLTAGDDLQNVLDKVEPVGGKIVVPKIDIGNNFGFSAHIMDTEGNKIGLWSKS